MKIAILGFGTVGSGVYKIMETKAKGSVKRILDMPENKDKLPIITSDINDILNDDEISLVVETMGGIHPAYEFIIQCMLHKKHVVSANKAVIASYLQEFLNTANNNQVSFFFEASVGGGIPWIASLLKAKRIDCITSFYGIFNGTSNFILDEMYQNNRDFKEVLKIAQDLGYAEKDPSADIDGYDVANKVAISSAIAFETITPVKDIICVGIRNITKEDITYFKKQHLCVKYIGEGNRLYDSYSVSVLPTLFDEKSIEANITKNFNIATLHGESIGDLKFYGQGAGQMPTANAIVQDILDIQNQVKQHISCANNLTLDQTLFTHQYIIRTKHLNSLLVTRKDEHYHYTDFISLDAAIKLYQKALQKDPNAILFKIA